MMQLSCHPRRISVRQHGSQSLASLFSWEPMAKPMGSPLEFQGSGSVIVARKISSDRLVRVF